MSKSNCKSNASITTSAASRSAISVGSSGVVGHDYCTLAHAHAHIDHNSERIQMIADKCYLILFCAVIKIFD